MHRENRTFVQKQKKKKYSQSSDYILKSLKNYELESSLPFYLRKSFTHRYIDVNKISAG